MAMTVMSSAPIYAPLGKGGRMSVVDDVIRILSKTLELEESVVAAITASSPLLGAIPEFDSIAVLAVIAALEEKFGFTLKDDEISAEVFESVGSLSQFVEQKLRAQ
jgi:acyl carrier protein